MDFNFSPEDEAFRQEVRAWLKENLPESWTGDDDTPAGDTAERYAMRIAWQRKLHAKGWAAPTWPREYGGGGLTVTQTVILDEELVKARAPQAVNGVALRFAGPTLIVSGTEEQKHRFIPKMINCEEMWCQGFSEPDAGSDLASLKCRAVADGDDYVINGQKVWSSGAHRADWCILLVRTDPKAPKHKGITYLLVDMHSPGIEVRPLKQMTGHANFDEIFFDNVRVPRKNIVGQENRGWYVAMTTLGFERTTTSRGIGFRRDIADLTRLAANTLRHGRPAIDDPAIRQQLAKCAIEAEIVALNGARVLTSRIKGQVPGPEAQMGKLFYSELNTRIGELATEILGMDVLLDQASEASQYWQYRFLVAKGLTIAAGTSEVLRNVIGERVLGLPK